MSSAKEKLVSGPKSDDPDEKEALIAPSEEQVAASAFKATKDKIFGLLCLSALVDTMGASLLAPAYAMAVSNAPASVAPEGGVHPDAFPTVPLPFSLAVNVIGSSLVLGGVFSSLTMGPVSDKLGRKPLILVGLLGGAVGYLLMWFAGQVVQSYTLFVAAMFINGLFSGTKSVMMAYLADVYSPEEFGQKQPIMGLCMLIGGSSGGIFGGIVISATGRLWAAAWGGVIASIFFAALIAIKMPEPAKKEPKKKEDGSATEEEAEGATAITKRILLLCTFAGMLDSLGDEGNKFARSTIMPQSYPVTKNPSTMSLVSSSNVLATAVCMFLVMGTQKKLGLAVYTVFGNAFSAVVQFALIYIVGLGPGSLVPYAIVWWLGQVFGFTSSMAQMILISKTAPRSERGFWTGMSNAAGNVSKFVGPLALSLLYGDDNLAQLVLSVCGSISLCATLAYLPLPSIMPPPPSKEHTLLDMDVYEKMPMIEFIQLPLEVRWKIDEQRKKAGKKSFMYGWGEYDAQQPYLAGMIERSHDDFAHLKRIMVDALTDREKLQGFLARMRQIREEKSSKQKEHRVKQEEMGRWIGDYFDDAGYEAWEFYPELFKAMMMNAFPPIDTLDSKAGSSTGSLKEFEQVNLNFLRVMDQHLASQLSKDPKNSAFLAAAMGNTGRP